METKIKKTIIWKTAKQSKNGGIEKHKENFDQKFNLPKQQKEIQPWT